MSAITASTPTRVEGRGGTAGVDDYSFLARLSNPDEIYFSPKGAEDFACLSGPKNLTRIYCGENYVELADFSVLSGLNGLQELEMPGDGVGSPRGLENLTELRILKLSFNSGVSSPITDLTPLLKLTRLQSLDLNVGSVTVLHALEPLAELRSIKIKGYGDNGHPPLMDISGLKTLTHLTSLNLPDYTKDLGPLRNLTNLATLELWSAYGDSNGYDGFSSLEPLRGLQQLTALDITIPKGGDRPVFSGGAEQSANTVYQSAGLS